MRHDRRCFGRLEQEDQRLKKHYGRWMDIVRSLELESFILTKLTKPSVPVNLVGPQVSLPLYWVPANRGSIHFFVRNKEALPCVRRYSWWVRAVSGGNIFSRNTEALSVGPRCQGEESFFGRLKQEYPSLKKKHDIRWMDIQRPLLLEPCVDYKLTKPCIRVNSVFLGDAST